VVPIEGVYRSLMVVQLTQVLWQIVVRGAMLLLSVPGGASHSKLHSHSAPRFEHRPMVMMMEWKPKLTIRVAVDVELPNSIPPRIGFEVGM
jgi:hypothetical protein